MNEKQKELIRKKLANMGLKLFEHMDAFQRNPMPKGNYCLRDEGFDGLNTKPPNKNAKNYKQIMQQLCTLKSYISHYKNVPADNFLNTFDNFDKIGNEKNLITAKEFLAAKSPLKALWIYGPTGIGKSHLLLSMVYASLELGVEQIFKELKPDQYKTQTIYGGEERQYIYPSEKNPNLLYINYMQDMIHETHHADSRSKIKRKFGYDNEKAIYFLDDVCEIEADKILTNLINMYEKKLGKTIITSNFSLSEWLNKFNFGRSTEGLKGRLETYIKEISLTGDNRRPNHW
ncbi:MAG: hypothetical protein ACP5NV_05670 [Candidatus Woesearchaeota archaeon]